MVKMKQWIYIPLAIGVIALVLWLEKQGWINKNGDMNEPKN